MSQSSTLIPCHLPTPQQPWFARLLCIARNIGCTEESLEEKGHIRELIESLVQLRGETSIDYFLDLEQSKEAFDRLERRSSNKPHGWQLAIDGGYWYPDGVFTEELLMLFEDLLISPHLTTRNYQVILDRSSIQNPNNTLTDITLCPKLVSWHLKRFSRYPRYRWLVGTLKGLLTERLFVMGMPWPFHNRKRCSVCELVGVLASLCDFTPAKPYLCCDVKSDCSNEFTALLMNIECVEIILRNRFGEDMVSMIRNTLSTPYQGSLASVVVDLIESVQNMRV
jgi:hypothetical protein